MLTSRRRHPSGLGNAAHSALASDDAAQPSSLAGSAEQPADESYRRAWDGELYTRAEFHEHSGSYLGEAHWQNAQDELTQWDGPANVSATETPRRRSAEQPVGTSSVAQNDTRDIFIEDQRHRSAEQLDESSAGDAAQI